MVAVESRLLTEETREETLERTEDKREEMLEVGKLALLEREEEAGRKITSIYVKAERGERRRTTTESGLKTRGLLNLIGGTVGLEALKDGLLIRGVHADARSIRAVRGRR